MHWMFIASSIGGSTIFVPHLFKLVRLKKRIKVEIISDVGSMAGSLNWTSGLYLCRWSLLEHF